jgi:chorismate mutase
LVELSEEMKRLRAEIDRVDQEILTKIRERIRLTEKIGQIKKINHSDILDEKRESELLSRLSRFGKSLGIEDKFILSLWREIIDYSHKVQEKCD